MAGPVDLRAAASAGGDGEGTHEGCPYGGDRGCGGAGNDGGVHEGTHKGCPLQGVTARAGVSATLEVLTRAPTRGAPTGGGREGGGECNVGGAHEGTHKGCPYGGWPRGRG